jgi:hypothetical protein
VDISDVFAEQRVIRVAEVLFEDEEVVGLHIATASGERFVLTDWTDWTLRVDRRTDDKLPDYFWPPDEHTLRVTFESQDGASVTSVQEQLDEMGELIAVRLTIEGFGSWSARADAEGFSWQRTAAA